MSGKLESPVTGGVGVEERQEDVPGSDLTINPDFDFGVKGGGAVDEVVDGVRASEVLINPGESVKDGISNLPGMPEGEGLVKDQRGLPETGNYSVLGRLVDQSLFEQSLPETGNNAVFPSSNIQQETDDDSVQSEEIVKGEVVEDERTEELNTICHNLNITDATVNTFMRAGVIVKRAMPVEYRDQASLVGIVLQKYCSDNGFTYDKNILQRLVQGLDMNSKLTSRNEFIVNANLIEVQSLIRRIGIRSTLEDVMEKRDMINTDSLRDLVSCGQITVHGNVQVKKIINDVLMYHAAGNRDHIYDQGLRDEMQEMFDRVTKKLSASFRVAKEDLGFRTYVFDKSVLDSALNYVKIRYRAQVRMERDFETPDSRTNQNRGKRKTTKEGGFFRRSWNKMKDRVKGIFS